MVTSGGEQREGCKKRRRQPKGAATEAAWFACTAELLLLFTKLRWQHQGQPKAKVFAKKAVLPTALGGGFAKQKAALPKPLVLMIQPH